MTTDRPVLGILLMLGFCLAAPLGDALAKLLGASMGVAQLVAIRMGLQVLLLTPVMVFLAIPIVMSGRDLRLSAVRALLHMAGIGLMFLSLRYLPLADAVAIAFVMPFIMLLLGYYILGEEVGRRRILACCVGFVGTCMVMQPSFAEVGWPALLPVGVAFVFAFFMLVTRQLARSADPIALQMVSGLFACAILVPLLPLLNGAPGFQLVWPDGWNWALLLAMGSLGTAAHLLMTWALRFAPSATLAPMQYLEIPVAALLGWLIFRDFPDGLALAGIAVTIGAGLYIIYREHLDGRSAPPEPHQAPPAAE
ncbi:MAG: DMT family transporter [Silicimonas sp.]|jgi:drug/metabolite transporter (DMT)-like permease|nr:DMT family transporter [Silicimonas sp.]